MNQNLSEDQFDGVQSRPKDPWMDQYMAGTLKQHKYPDEIDTPLYHGTTREIEGDQIVPGKPGNFVRRMKHAYVTTDLETARHYARGSGTVYEVSATGPIGHRRDARGNDFASEFPFKIRGKV